jgi:serine/threonine protein phosphatase 1
MQDHSNKFERTIVIGDIHGCYDEFQLLLEKVNWNESKDRLVLVGDIINKGPKSTEMLEWIFMHPTVVCLLGNHEWAFLQYLNEPFEHEQFEALSHEFKKDRKHLISWIEELPLFYEDNDLIVVHAGLQPGKEIEKQDRRILTTIRTWDGNGQDLKNPDNPAWFDFYYGPKTIVFGHWAALGLVQRENLVGLDSGCVYGKQLSAYIHPNREIVQVQAKQTYRQIC